MTRDPAGNARPGGAWGPRGPAGRRQPRDGTAPFPAGDRDWGPVPGYEFEGRSSPSGPPPRNGTGPSPAAQRGRPEWRDGGDQPRRFRYTPTTSGPQPGPPPSPPSPPQGAQVRPGFEFDAAAPRTGWTTRPLSPDPFSPGLFSADHFNAPPFRPGPGRPGPHQPRIQQKAGTEWTRLLRSFVPEPAKRTWFKQFLSALEFRGLALRGAVLIMTMIVLGVAAVVIAGASSGGDPGQAPPPAALGFPPATLAGGQFTAAASGRGISQTLGQVASDGAEIVAVGSQDRRAHRPRPVLRLDRCRRDLGHGHGAHPGRRPAAPRLRGQLRGRRKRRLGGPGPQLHLDQPRRPHLDAGLDRRVAAAPR